MKCKSSLIGLMGMFCRWPRPSAIGSALIVIKSLLQFFSCVHHKWAMLCNRLTYWLSLQHEQMACSSAIDNGCRLSGIQYDAMLDLDIPFFNLQSLLPDSNKGTC